MLELWATIKVWEYFIAGGIVALFLLALLVSMLMDKFRK